MTFDFGPAAPYQCWFFLSPQVEQELIIFFKMVGPVILFYFEGATACMSHFGTGSFLFLGKGRVLQITRVHHAPSF